MAECREFKLVVWLVVHRIHNYSSIHNRYSFNSSLYSFIDVLNLQVVSNENSTSPCGDVQLLVTFQLYWALFGL